MSYENPWIYNGQPFDSGDIGDYFGYVYLITNVTTGRKYIGRKYFYSRRKPRPDGTNKKRRRVTSESDWKKYYGSSPELKADIKEFGKFNFRREILSLHTTGGRVNYEETRQLFMNNVLTESMDDGSPKYYNANILSRYFRKDYFDK